MGNKRNEKRGKKGGNDKVEKSGEKEKLGNGE